MCASWIDVCHLRPVSNYWGCHMMPFFFSTLPRLIQGLLATILLMNFAACQPQVHESQADNKNVKSKFELAKLFDPLEVDTESKEHELVVLAIEREIWFQEFRTQGLKLWDADSGNEERYDWLVAAVHFEPYYPLDILAWAQDELKLGPNTAAVMDNKGKEWDALYPSMKNEFMMDSSVSLSKKRLLEAGELRSKIFACQRAREIGRDCGDVSSLVDDIFNFAERYNAPISKEDSAAFDWDVKSVIFPAFDRNDTLGMRSMLTTVLAERMVNSGNEMLFEYGSWLLSPDGSVPRDRYDGLAFLLLADDWEKGVDSWQDINDHPQNGEVLAAIFASSISFPSFHRTVTDSGRWIERDAREFGTRKFRALGLLNWNRMTLDEKSRWLYMVSALPSVYPASYPELVYGNYDVLHGYSERSGNWPLLERMDSVVFSKFDEVISASNGLDPQKRLGIISYRSRFALLRAGQLYRALGNRDPVDKAIVDIMDLLGDPATAYIPLQHLSVMVASDPTRFGLTTTEYQSLWTPYIQSDLESVRAYAQSVLSKVGLVRGASIEFSAPDFRSNDITSLDDYDDKIVLVDNWDTDCAPCIAAFPSLHEVYLEYKDKGFEVVSVPYDGSSQRAEVERLTKRLGLTWTTLSGEGLWPAVSTKYNLNGFPAYMLIDRKGRLISADRRLGYAEDLREILDQHLIDEVEGYYDRKPAMWKVSDADTVMYFYGTIHNVKSGFDWFDNGVREVLSSSDIVYFEIPQSKRPTLLQLNMLRQKYFKNEKGVQLSSFLSSEQIDGLKLSASNAGVSWDELQAYTPDGAVAVIGKGNRAKLDVQAGQSVEAAVFRIAKENNVEERAFATFEQQFSLLAEISEEGQVEYLMSSITDNGSETFDHVFQAWFWGDLDTLERLGITKPMQAMPEAYQALIVERNKNWAAELANVMEREAGTVFVAVGVGHLVGPDSLQAMLSDYGYTAERVH